MTKYDRYLTVCRKLGNRYRQRDINGHYLNRSIGGVPSRYHHLETLAAEKYLGCNPAKLRTGADYSNAPADLTIWKLPI